MKRSRQFRVALAVFVSLMMVCTPATAGTTYAPGDPYIFISSQESGQHNIYFHDGVGSHGNGGFGNHSFMLNQDLYRSTEGRPSEDPTCTSLSTESCASAKNILWNAELPQCADASDTNCISGFGIAVDGQPGVAGKFQSYFPSKAQNSFLADKVQKIPAGSTSNVYSLQNSDGSSTTFMVASYLSGIYHRDNNRNEIAGFNLSITPVQITPALNPGPCITNETNIGLRGGPCSDDGYVKLTANKTYYGEAGGVGADCGDGLNHVFAKANFDKLCATEIPFPSLDSYYVNLRLNNPPSGWMHGRLSDASISITKNANGNEYKFVGKPVPVPLLYKTNFWKDLPDSITTQYDAETGQFKNSHCDGASGRLLSAEDFKNPLLRNFTAMPCPSGALSIKELNLWLPQFNNTATAAPAYWNVRTITTQETEGANPCFKDPNQITGIVTTNSTNYTSGPPTFDKQTGELNYQVAAPHYLPDGKTVFKGVYNLIMRSDVARCIYGFSQAPVSASITVISENGAEQIATTSVGEKDGWMKLSAVNFEFSSPKLKVKLNQSTPAPIPAASNSKSQTTTAASSQKTITCSKGKITKKVSGSDPKCPAGYIKK